MNKNFFRYIWLIFIIVAVIPVAGCSTEFRNSIKPVNGTLDLSQWKLSDGTVELNGEWEFYWNKLLTNSEFNDQKNLDAYIVTVPQPWSKYTSIVDSISDQGYATYRLHVRTSLPAGSFLSLKIGTFSSSYKLFINDSEIASSGIVSSSCVDYVPGYNPQTCVFSTSGGDFDIIVQVANFHFHDGGFWNSISLGTYKDIQSLKDISLGKELFIIGALALSALYYLSFFLMKRVGIINLYFSLTCMIAILTYDLLNEMLLVKLFPGINFKCYVFLWYNSTQWLPFVFLLYVGELFASKYHKAVTKVLFTITLFCTSFTLIAPISLYTRFGRVGDYIMLLQLACTIILAVSGLKSKKTLALMYLVATTVMLLSALHDFLLAANRINSPFGSITSFGFFIVLLVHILMNSRISANEYNEKIRLLTELQNSRIFSIINERKFLLAQIKPHFIFNALSVIASVCTQNSEEARKLVVSLGEYLRNSFDFGSGDDLVPLSKEIELLKAYIEIEKARFGDRIKFELICGDYPDFKIPRLSIQPMVENAIRHGILKKPYGGNITVKIEIKNEYLNVAVIDDGFGMTKELVEDLLGNSENIKGVGIKNINSRLIGIYGSGITIKSVEGEGTSCHFSIPIDQQLSEYSLQGGITRD